MSYEPYTCTSILSMRNANILVHIAAHSIIVDINISVHFLLSCLINGTRLYARLYEMTLEILEIKTKFLKCQNIEEPKWLIVFVFLPPKNKWKCNFLVLSDKDEDDQMSSTPRVHGSTNQFLFR